MVGNLSSQLVPLSKLIAQKVGVTSAASMVTFMSKEYFDRELLQARQARKKDTGPIKRESPRVHFDENRTDYYCDRPREREPYRGYR
jgi:hypothetical protein